MCASHLDVSTQWWVTQRIDLNLDLHKRTYLYRNEKTQEKSIQLLGVADIEK